MSEEGPGQAWAELSRLRKTGITGMRENQWFDLIKAANSIKEETMPFKTTPEDIDHMFKYHPPKPDQVAKYEELREEARKFAQTILRLTPGCPDQTAAIRHVRLSVMVANAAIALEKPDGH